MGRKAVSKTRKTVTDKQRKWVEQLYPLLNQRGLEKLTMDSIAEMMGKSKSTVYEYFRSKEALVEAVIQYKLGQLGGFEQILNDESIPFQERYVHVMQHVSTTLSDITTKLLTGIKQHFPELWKKIELFIDFATGILQSHYEDGIERGVYNETINPSILILSDRLFFQAISDPAFLRRQRLTIEQAFDQYLKLKFYGMLKPNYHVEP